VRYLIIIVAAGFCAGCAADVVMVNPRTGEAGICRDELLGLNPWSQKEACVGDYLTRGWIRATRD
jgi:hypothetical protein